MPRTAPPAFIAPMQEALQGLGGAASKRFQQALPAYKQQLSGALAGAQGAARYAQGAMQHGIPYSDVGKAAGAVADMALPRLDPNDPASFAMAFGMPVMGAIPTTKAAFSDILADTQVRNKRGLPRMVFHGTSRPRAPGAPLFEEAAMADNLLWGPGFYFTESPYIAGGPEKIAPLGYASGPMMEKSFYGGVNAQSLRNLMPELRQDIAAEAERDYQMLASKGIEGQEWLPIRARREKVPGTQYHAPYNRINVKYTAGNPQVIPAYLAMANPLNLDRPIGAAAARSAQEAMEPWMLREMQGPSLRSSQALYGRPGPEGRIAPATSGGDLYHLLRALYESRPDAGMGNEWWRARDFLEDLGYDGATHIGGGLTQNTPHRVWISWHPEQVVPAYGPKKQF